MLTVAELLADPALGLALVAGEVQADREIEAAAVSELSHPGPWLQGGELLLTIGLLMPDSTDGCLAYMTELHRAGVRAVGLGLGAELPHQCAPERLIAAADALDMPLLTVPDGVPFIAVTKAVFAYRARAERRILERTLQTQRALTAAAVSPGGLMGILAAHREATGRAGVIVDQLGRVLAQTDSDGAQLVERMAGPLSSVRDHGLAAAAVDIGEGRRRELHGLGAQRLRAWLLIDGPAELPAAEQITGDLVSLLSLELERRHGLDSAARRERALVLDRLARGTVDDAVAARWLASLGLKDADQRAAAISAPDDAEEVAADLLTALRDALVRVVGTVVEVAVPLATDLPAALATLVRRQTGRDRHRRAAWCRSGVVTASSLGVAGEPDSGSPSARRGHREQPDVAQRRRSGCTSRVHRCGAGSARRDRPGRRTAAGAHRVSRAQRPLGGGGRGAARAPAHHAQPD